MEPQCSKWQGSYPIELTIARVVTVMAPEGGIWIDILNDAYFCYVAVTTKNGFSIFAGGFFLPTN